MKVFQLLPMAAAAAGLVIPDSEVMSQIAVEPRPARSDHSFFDKVPAKAEEVVDDFKSQLDAALDASRDTIDRSLDSLDDALDDVLDRLEGEAHADEAAAWTADADGGHHHHGKPKKPHKPHKPKKPTKTVYELIAESKYTTKLAKAISDFPELVDALNSTKANFTVFAPTDKAFDKIPKHAPTPSKDFLAKLLSYHVVPDVYPAGRVLVSHTVPTLLEGEFLSEEPRETPQRLSFHLGLRGLTVNFFSRVVAIDYFGTNGVVHGVDSILIPPPGAAEIITFFPSEYSTLELGLIKTGLFEGLNDTSNHLGGTIFAPSNWAFKKLGPKINAFLFSSYGEKYLKALLKYHVVANETLYSDAFYKASGEVESTTIPKGLYHVDLPTLLEDRSLSIDIARFGGIIDVRINGYVSVAIQDGIAKDGVIHALNNVLIPPKNLDGELVTWEGEEINVEDLKERLDPFVEKDGNKAVLHEYSWEL